jgi:hypothetical protein
MLNLKAVLEAHHSLNKVILDLASCTTINLKYCLSSGNEWKYWLLSSNIHFKINPGNNLYMYLIWMVEVIFLILFPFI